MKMRLATNIIGAQWAEGTDAVVEIADKVAKNPDLKPAVFLLRGLRGTGKSTFADMLVVTSSFCPNKVPTGRCSIDTWFAQREEDLVFGKYKVANDWMEQESVEYCKGTFLYHLDEGKRIIVVDNTNLRKTKCDYFINKAVEKNYDVHVVEFHVKSEEEAKFVASRSSRIRDVEMYPGWKRWQRFESYENAFIVTPYGLPDGIASNPDASNNTGDVDSTPQGGDVSDQED